MPNKPQPFDFRSLDDVIHAPPRLGIMTVLVAVQSADFTFLKERLEMTDGNIGMHLRKLEEAGYVSAKKSFVDRKPRTSYAVTAKGRRAFESYLEQLEKLLKQT